MDEVSLRLTNASGPSMRLVLVCVKDASYSIPPTCFTKQESAEVIDCGGQNYLS
jgi:hypothetical protein